MTFNYASLPDEYLPGNYKIQAARPRNTVLARSEGPRDTTHYLELGGKEGTTTIHSIEGAVIAPCWTFKPEAGE